MAGEGKSPVAHLQIRVVLGGKHLSQQEVEGEDAPRVLLYPGPPISIGAVQRCALVAVEAQACPEELVGLLEASLLGLRDPPGLGLDTLLLGGGQVPLPPGTALAWGKGGPGASNDAVGERQDAPLYEGGHRDVLVAVFIAVIARCGVVTVALIAGVALIAVVMQVQGEELADPAREVLPDVPQADVPCDGWQVGRQLHGRKEEGGTGMVGLQGKAGIPDVHTDLAKISLSRT